MGKKPIVKLKLSSFIIPSGEDDEMFKEGYEECVCVEKLIFTISSDLYSDVYKSFTI